MLAPDLFREPQGTSAIEPAIIWLAELIAGSFGLVLMMLAIAIYGLGLLSGQLQVKRGVSVVLGCFVLIGASQLSAFLTPDQSRTTYSAVSTPPLAVEPEPVRSLPGVAPSQSGPNPFAPYAQER